MTPTKTLERLFTAGTCAAGDASLARLLKGLAHLSSDGNRWVMSRQLLGLRQTLGGDQEAVAAVLATELDVRAPWARLLAARCREAGQLADANALAQLVTRLGGAAAWVEAAMPEATLEQTTQAALERDLIGSTAEQAQATPVLTRVMAGASRLVEWQRGSLPGLKPLDPTGSSVDANWCPGRLIARPGVGGSDEAFVLCGRWSDEEMLGPLDWVLRSPWALLLAAIGYVQDSWAAEGYGGLLLELPSGQSPHNPSEISVLVVGRDGSEMLCGSLGGFILGLLSRLNMGLFSEPLTEAALNACLSTLIGDLQRRQVWRFQDGLSGQQGFYRIHPAFSDACYQIRGVQTLGLNGRSLRRAALFISPSKSESGAW